MRHASGLFLCFGCLARADGGTHRPAAVFLPALEEIQKQAGLGSYRRPPKPEALCALDGVPSHCDRSCRYGAEFPPTRRRPRCAAAKAYSVQAASSEQPAAPEAGGRMLLRGLAL